MKKIFLITLSFLIVFSLFFGFKNDNIEIETFNNCFMGSVLSLEEDLQQKNRRNKIFQQKTKLPLTKPK